MIDHEKMKYSVGALMYSSALNEKISESVIREKFGSMYSLALCLEDTIADQSVEDAERQLVESIRKIYDAHKERDFYLPKLFIRVRKPEQVLSLFQQLEPYQDIIWGFIFPKYTIANAQNYNDALLRVNAVASKLMYMMPILESKDIVDFRMRSQTLSTIKGHIDSVRDYVLNIRVGGNDFSNEFAVRRSSSQSIYDILPIAQLMGDILTVFSRDYVVSGPVWEYFSSENDAWKTGLINELKLDKLNGFIGKTVIHPNQIAVVNEVLRVSKSDFEDAKTILNWEETGLQVGRCHAGERMNEVKTHTNWALKIIKLSDIYGVS